jgi:hypothetical protein
MILDVIMLDFIDALPCVRGGGTDPQFNPKGRGHQGEGIKERASRERACIEIARNLTKALTAPFGVGFCATYLYQQQKSPYRADEVQI